MRAQSVYHGNGNYCRAIKEAEEVRERHAQNRKDDFYKKAGVLRQKANDSDELVLSERAKNILDSRKS